jgi:hypothetical protein
VRYVGGGGEDPERREAEGRDRAELDDVAGALPHREPAGVGLELVRCLEPRLDASDELDRHPKQVLRRRLVEPRAANDARQGELERLVEGAAEQGADAADEALGKRSEEGERPHRR